IGFRCEFGAALFELFAQLAEVLDDPVVDHRQALGRMRMRVFFAWPPMRCPAGMADADRAHKRLVRELLLEIAQPAFRASSLARPAFERRKAGRIVAAIFEPLERINEVLSDRLPTKYSDNSTHGQRPYLFPDESCFGEVVRRLKGRLVINIGVDRVTLGLMLEPSYSAVFFLLAPLISHKREALFSCT